MLLLSKKSFEEGQKLGIVVLFYEKIAFLLLD